MGFTKNIITKLIIIIVTISILLMFVSTPASYAKLDLKDGDFYYSGTTKGTYTVSQGIFAWLLSCIGDIADWLVGIMTMGIRMVFVGWTALFERLLTTALQSTMGVDINNRETSATDYTTYADSSYNVTVEAIIFNRVPALNADFFDFDYDKTVTGTGKKLICDNCGKSPDKCDEDCECHAESTKEDKVKECESCLQYDALVEAGDKVEPVIIQVKKAVATWYYMIRMLACAAMLIVLVFVGIKMAISTIASDKAVYKRMLVDWIAGMILIFTLHYFMIFVLTINSAVVNSISTLAAQLNEVDMKQLTKTDENGNASNKYSSDEIEIKVYEEIRTRAYDAKLTVGTSGMVMYMTLVYFAFRYTLVYLKRMLTVAVLILMSPAVGVGYAMQKALSGRSQVITTWMTEYVMTIIIQIVHALLYAIFISKALILSLESVSGMIVALILMNYTLKADKLFRKIFKMGESDSLAGSSAEAGSAEAIQEKLNTAKGLAMSAKPLKELATKSPGVLAATALGRGMVTGYTRSRAATPERLARLTDKEMDKHFGGSAFKRDENGRDAESEEQYENRRKQAEAAVKSKHSEFSKSSELGKTLSADEQKVYEKGNQQLKENLTKTEETYKLNPTEKNKREYEAAKSEYSTYARITTPTTKEINRAHKNKIMNYDNTFKSNGIEKTLFTQIFGSSHYDKATGTYVKDNNSVLDQYSLENRFGITKEQQKLLKEDLKMASGALLGVGGIFLGMGTFVAHPKMGMAMMAAGGVGVHGAFAKEPYTAKNYVPKKYKFKEFSPDAMKSIRYSAMKMAKETRDRLTAEQIKEDHDGFYQKLKAGTLTAGTIGAVGGGIATLALGMGAVGVLPAATLTTAAVAGTNAVRNNMRNSENPARRRTRLGAQSEKITLETMKNNQKVMEEFKKESLDTMKNSLISKMLYKKDHEIEDAEDKEKLALIDEEIEKSSHTYDDKTGKMSEKDNPDATQEEKDAKAAFDAVLVQQYLEQGIRYNPENGTLTPLKPEELKKEIETVKKEDMQLTVEDTNEMTQTDINQINTEIDNALAIIASGEEIDIKDKSYIDKAMKIVESNLKSGKMLKSKESLSSILTSKDSSRIEQVIATRAKVTNAKTNASKKALEAIGLSAEDQKTLTEAITNEINSSSTSKKEASIDEIMAKFDENRKVKPGDTQSQQPQQGQQTQQPQQGQESSDGPNPNENESRNAQIRQYVKSRVEEQQKAILIRNINSSINSAQGKARIKKKGSQVKNDLDSVLALVLSDTFETSENVEIKVSSENKELSKKETRQSTLSKIDLLEETLTEIDKTGNGGSLSIKSTKENQKQDASDPDKIYDKKQIDLSKNGASASLEMLLMAKELKELNKIGLEEFEVTTVGTKAFKSKRIDLSEVRADRLTKEIELQLETDKRDDAIRRGDKAEEKSIKDKISKLDAEIRTKEYQESKIKDSTITAGPIVNVEDTLKKLKEGKL